MRKRIKKIGLLTSALLGLLAAAVLSMPVIAQEVGDAHVDPDAIARQERFARISADIHAETGVPEASWLGAHPCTDGKAGPYPCSNVDLLSFVPVSSVGGGVANEVWGWRDRASDEEYAILGRSTGTALIDISDPTQPVYMGELPTHSGVSDWRDIKVYRNWLYVVSESGGHGMQVFDLRHLRDVKNPPVTFSADAHYRGFGTAHNIVINEDSSYAYVVGSNSCGWGLHIIDISVPKEPSFVNCYAGDGYVHDAQCVMYHGPDTRFNESEICFAFNEDTLTIIDVTNKQNIVMLARRSYPNVEYTHQGWLSEDHAYLLLGDEEDETAYGHNTRTRIWRLDDLRNPELLGSRDGPGPSTDHNMYVFNNQLYQSNYTGGLQMFSLGKLDQVRLPLLGYFDTYLASNGTEYKGSWSNYPYHRSGVILVSSINEGLFVLKPWPDMLVSPKPFAQTVKTGDTVSAELIITNRGIGTLKWTVFTDRADAVVPCQFPQPVDWLLPKESGGRAVPGTIRPVEIVMDAGALAAGRHDAYLCVGGDDPDKPLVDVQVMLFVTGEVNIYLPSVGSGP